MEGTRPPELGPPGGSKVRIAYEGGTGWAARGLLRLGDTDQGRKRGTGQDTEQPEQPSHEMRRIHADPQDRQSPVGRPGSPGGLGSRPWRATNCASMCSASRRSGTVIFPDATRSESSCTIESTAVCTRTISKTERGICACMTTSKPHQIIVNPNTTWNHYGSPTMNNFWTVPDKLDTEARKEAEAFYPRALALRNGINPYQSLGLGTACAYCGGPNEETEHTIPKSHFRKNPEDKKLFRPFTVTTCKDCNDKAAAGIDQTFYDRRNRIALKLIAQVKKNHAKMTPEALKEADRRLRYLIYAPLPTGVPLDLWRAVTTPKPAPAAPAAAPMPELSDQMRRWLVMQHHRLKSSGSTAAPEAPGTARARPAASQ